MSPDKLIAALVVIACAVMLVRLVLGSRRRASFDRFATRWSRRLSAKVEGVFTWNSSRRRARREAEQAISRARGQGGQWDGNVYRPKSFKKDRKIH